MTVVFRILLVLASEVFDMFFPCDTIYPVLKLCIRTKEQQGTAQSRSLAYRSNAISEAV
jgi:hypothetical protein